MDKVRTLKSALQTLYEYAPNDVYEYFTLGKENILMTLSTSRLTDDLVPMLKEFYKQYGGNEYAQQYQAILHQ